MKPVYIHTIQQEDIGKSWLDAENISALGRESRVLAADLGKEIFLNNGYYHISLTIVEYTIKMEYNGTVDDLFNIFAELFPIARRLGLKLEISSRGRLDEISM